MLPTPPAYTEPVRRGLSWFTIIIPYRCACAAAQEQSLHLLFIIVQMESKPSIQIHYYGTGLHNGDCHLVNISELYTCFFSTSYFHPVTLDLTGTEDLTGLTNSPSPPPQMGVVDLLHSMLQGTVGCLE